MSPVITRRDFARTVGLAVAATSVASCTSPSSPAPPSPHTSFAALKQIDAGVLNVGYAEDGPADGPPVILLHGWPYDIHSYVDVAPILAAKGYRVLVPYLRGYGSTGFRAANTVRNAQQAVLGADLIAFMDALNIQRAVLAGYDWGARTADIVAALWPDRVKALVSVSGYLIVNLVANQQPLSPEAEHGWWYQYYFATDRGVRGYRANTYDFNRLIWQEASPTWKFDDATYDRTSAAFTNPDHVDIVIHNYRWRLGRAPGFRRHRAQRAAGDTAAVRRRRGGRRPAVATRSRPSAGNHCAGCHGGPGITFIPGYNAGHQVLEDAAN
jgi:pimeloyl-ACP methyl ester carboxylesterase